jgi:glycerol-3-phosphate dehydrogenase (NAD(P)+)
MEQITVLGAGSWGTALAIVLADNGHNVKLWGLTMLSYGAIVQN